MNGSVLSTTDYRIEAAFSQELSLVRAVSTTQIDLANISTCNRAFGRHITWASSRKAGEAKRRRRSFVCFDKRRHSTAVSSKLRHDLDKEALAKAANMDRDRDRDRR